MKSILLSFLTATILMIWASCVNNNTEEKPLIFDTVGIGNINLHLETYQLTDGWGYKVSVDGKKLINQKIIPTITGRQPFKTSQDAYKVGRLVTQKLASGSTLPSITISELINLGIIEKK